MALPILPALMRGLAVTKIADKLVPKNADQLETAVNVVSSMKPKEQENRSLAPVESVSDDKMTILPPEEDKEKSIKESMDVFRQILDNLIMIKENVLGIKTGLSESQKLELEARKEQEAKNLESRVESERALEDAGDDTKVSIVQAAKKGLGLLGKLIIGIFAFDVLRKLFKKFAPDLYGKIEKGIFGFGKEVEESVTGGLLIDSVKNIGKSIKQTVLGVFNIILGALTGDAEQFSKGIRQFTDAIFTSLDNLLNPIIAIFEIPFSENEGFEKTRNILQKGLEKFYDFSISVEEFFREFELAPIIEMFSFENIKNEITKLGDELVDGFKQLFVDLKDFFSFSNLKRIITGQDKPVEQQIEEITGDDAKKEQREQVINELTETGQIQKERFFEGGVGNKEYEDLSPNEKSIVDNRVKNFQEQKLKELNLEGPSAPDFPDVQDGPPIQVVPEKDPDKISMGASMRNFAMDPKPMAMVARTTNAPTNVNNNSSSSVVSTTFNNNKGGGGGSIGTRNAETSLYAGLVPSFMQGTRG